MSDLFEYYKVNKASAILNKLENDNNLEILSLRTKVNIEEFSSGEKQIYILCLYWSLIKTSRNRNSIYNRYSLFKNRWNS